MNFKRFFSQAALALLCMGSFTAQMPAMQAPIQQELARACIGCNKYRKSVKNLPCEHPVCSACDERINDGFNNLGTSSFCPSCDALVNQGDIIMGPQGQILNKILFNPALHHVSTKQSMLPLAITAAFTFLPQLIPMGQNAERICAVSGMALFPLLTGYFKLQNINMTIENATHVALTAPHLGTVIEKRAKAFKNKFGTYCVANALILPALVMLDSKLSGRLSARQDIALSAVGVLVWWSSFLALHEWGSKYESIPKLK